MTKKILSLLLILGVVFTSCKKDSPVVVDARDKFVGTWNGTYKEYVAGVLVYTGPSTYTITKDASNANRILISDAVSGFVNLPATVNGSSYTVSNYSFLETDYSTIFNATGVLSGNTITENASAVETDLTTGDIFNYTSITSLSK